MPIRRVILLFACMALVLGRAWGVPVQILATGDMHGWIESQKVGTQTQGGAAEMLAYWKLVEGYAPEKFLVVSCGDVATGPAISTVYKGEPVIRVMNLMGYDVSALGNHEFDFGIDGLKNLAGWAKFPFLAGNLYNPDGTPADTVARTMLYEEQGVKVGVIGLVVRDVAAIANTNGMKTKPYAESVRVLTPELRKQGAQVIIVVAHAPMAELTALADEVADLHIPLMLGGHSHEFGQMQVGNTWIVSNGEWWKGYSRINLDVDTATGDSVVTNANQVWLQQKLIPAVDPAVQAEVARWQEKVTKDFGAPIAYSAVGLKRPWGVGNFVMDCWLAEYPADIAISNQGGFRQDLPPGDLRKSDLIGIMPFTNSIVKITLTGAQLASYPPTTGETLNYGGIKRKGKQMVWLKTGQPLEDAKSYTVLINDYLYNKSPHLTAADPTPEKVDADWRNPVLQWLAKHPSGKDAPLEKLVDTAARAE